MARIRNPSVSDIYDAADAFRTKCLLQDGSLLFEGQTVWHPEALKDLHARFVNSPDETDRPFLVKLKDQIGTAGPDVIRLAAEVLCVYFLFPSNVGGDKKREVVNEVLTWADASMPRSHPVASAFASGIGSGGYGYNTRRPFELWYLINLVIAWKRLPTDRQAELIEQPWQFMAFADEIDDGNSRQLRHMLLHLLFPNDFERIASSAHKRRVAAAFSALAGEAVDEGEDHRILAIRRALESLIPGKELDFYNSPLAEAWGPEEGGDAKAASLEVIQHKKQVIFFGPPGTGKTYRAKRLAERIIRSAALKKWGAATYFKSEQQLKKALDGNVHRLQLHPAFSYEDFVRALHIGSHGGTEYRPGYLPRLIEDIDREPQSERLPHILILDEINRTDLSRMLGECFSLLEDRGESVELPGHDAHGATMRLRIPDDLYIIGTMNLIDQSVEQLDFALRRRFLWFACPFDTASLLEAAEWRWNRRQTGVAWNRVEQDFRKLAGAARNLNSEIEKSPLLGVQYQVGHTYFLDVVAFLVDAIGGANRKSTFLWDRAGRPLEPVTLLWDLSLQPLLDQYLAGLSEGERGTELKRLNRVFGKAADIE